MSRKDPLAQHRAAAAKLVDRIASDPTYRRRLLDNPTEALETLLGLAGVRQEVAGRRVASALAGKCGSKKTCDQTCGKLSCKNGTCYWSCVYTSRVAEEV